MNVQEYIEFYHRNEAEDKIVLDLCLVKPLPSEYRLEDNFPGAVLSVIQINSVPNEYSINTDKDSELIQFSDGERTAEITAFLDCCVPADDNFFKGNTTIYFEFCVDRYYYETYIPSQSMIFNYFMQDKVTRVELIKETDEKLTMLMRCVDIHVFALFIGYYRDFCAVKMKWLKNIPELNDFVTKSIEYGVDIAEYGVFHA